MAVATPLGEDIGGYAGPANLYRLDPPLDDGTGEFHEHVVVWVQPALALSLKDAAGRTIQTKPSIPECAIVSAYPTGAAKAMNRLPGSYVHPAADHAWALLMAGYEVGPPDPPEPEPPVDPPVDPPTDPEPEPETPVDPPVEPEPEVP